MFHFYGEQSTFDAAAGADGALTAKELAQLCASLGSTLEPSELEAALTTLDKNSDGKIEYAEFIDWWRGSETGSVILY